MKQRERRALEIVVIRMPTLAGMEILTRLQAADANALIKIQSRAPPQVQMLLEVMPDIPLFPQHAWSICQQAVGKDIGRSRRSLLKCSSD